MSDQDKQELLRLQAEQTIIRMVNGIDSKQWASSQETFHDTVFVDYSSLNGQPGADTPAAELIAGWQHLLAKVTTHHMVSNFQINVHGTLAESECHVYARHTCEGLEGWDCYGRYLHTLQYQNNCWQITRMTLLVHGQTGNRLFLQQIPQ